jgi:dTDP-4-dehydrorhamnose reductase
MQKLLVTGASGLLGSKVVTCAKRRYAVIPLHNTHPLHPNSLRLDVTNLSEVLNLFKKLNPQIVVHTASETNVDKCETQRELAWKVNVEGARNVAVACNKSGARLIYISTDYVFSGQKGDYDEQDEPSPVNYYGFTKLEGESQVRQHCKNYIIMRTSVIYGWHAWKQNFATWIINSLEQNKEIAVVENHYNTPTLADNLAELTIEALQKHLKGLYHASGSQRISRFSFAKQIAKTFSLEEDLIKPIRMSQVEAWIAKRPRDSSLNVEKIKRQLRTKPLNISEGLKRMKKEAKT